MNLTYGDFIILEIALQQYLSSLDLSTQSGQYISSLLGKIEYNLQSLSASAQKEMPLTPPLMQAEPKA